MIISKKRIRSIEKYVYGLSPDEHFFVALDSNKDLTSKLEATGFTKNLQDGETVLPSIKGPVSRFNALGNFKRLKHLPKETCYREGCWEWKDWAGNYYSKIVYIPYERYQREIIPPPSEELTLVHNMDAALVTSRKLIFSKEQYGQIVHIINLFLELFGECRIIKEDYTPTFKSPVVRLNWQILPSGEYPWEKVQKNVSNVIENLSDNRKAIIYQRFDTICKYNPEFVAIGAAGFYGYFIFGFPKKNLFLLESIYLGNATYVFDKDWRFLSQLTKAEILDADLHHDRLIHKDGWILQIQKLLKSNW